MIFLSSVSQNSWFCWKSIPAVTDKCCNLLWLCRPTNTQTQIYVHMITYIHRKNIGQEELMQLLPLPRTFPMLPCSPGRFHHLLLCRLFYWKSWFYVLHWVENFISFVANRRIIFRVRLEHIWFLIVWIQGKPAKEWGALSPSSHFPQSLSSWDKKLRSCQEKDK